MRVNNRQLKLNTQVMNTTITSDPQELFNIYGYAIQVFWSGTPTGTFKLQVSADPVAMGNPANPKPTNWTDLIDSPYAVSAAGNYMWNVFDAMYNWVRLVYTDGSGGISTAAITLSTINIKGI